MVITMTEFNYKKLIISIAIYMGCAKRSLIACKKLEKEDSAYKRQLAEKICLLDFYSKKISNLAETYGKTEKITDDEFYDYQLCLSIMIYKAYSNKNFGYSKDVITLKSPGKYKIQIPIWTLIEPLNFITKSLTRHPNCLKKSESMIYFDGANSKNYRDIHALTKTYFSGIKHYMIIRYGWACGSNFEYLINKIIESKNLIQFIERMDISIFDNISTSFTIDESDSERLELDLQKLAGCDKKIDDK